MTQYMVVAKYREGTNWDDVLPLIPEEQAHVERLRSAGVLRGLYLAQGRQTVFLMFEAESEAEAREALTSLPLSRFWEAEVTPLEAPLVALS